MMTRLAEWIAAASCVLGVVAAPCQNASTRLLPIGDAERLEIQMHISAAQVSAEWPPPPEIVAEEPSSAQRVDLLMQLRVQAATLAALSGSSQCSCELVATLQPPAPDALPVRLFGLSELSSRPWPVVISHPGDRWQVDHIGVERGVRLSPSRDRAEALADGAVSRLMPALRPPGALSPDEHTPPFWVLNTPRGAPNADTVQFIASGEATGQPIMLRIIRSELTGGQVTIERYRTEYVTDPANGAVLSERTWFRISNHGLIDEQFAGRWEATYTWHWRP